MTLKDGAKFKGKLNLRWQTDIRNSFNFHASCQNSESMHFNVLLLSKAYKNMHEKVQKSYVSWHWKVKKCLKKNWLLVPKTTWGIRWILMRAVQSLKICILVGYFCRKYLMIQLKKDRWAASWKMTYGFKNDKKFVEFSRK